MPRIALIIHSLVIAIGLAVSLTSPVVAQNLGSPVTPVLVVDSERVFQSSRLGQRIDDDLKTRFEALAAENKTIENALTAEEQDLTAKRPDLPVAEFRELADAFDAKVQAIRVQQDAKQRELQALRDDQSSSFSSTIEPILRQIGFERGAIVILERRSVLLLAESIDITDEVIARINADVAVSPQSDTNSTDGSD